MDITGDDSDIEEAVARDADDYSSYELDDSDEVLGKQEAGTPPQANAEPLEVKNSFSLNVPLGNC